MATGCYVFSIRLSTEGVSLQDECCADASELWRLGEEKKERRKKEEETA